MEISLPSGRKIGDGHPCLIIAEVGSNWATLEDCMTSISQAKACGADAVKFQAYDHVALYGFIHRQTNTKNMVGTLPLEWLPKLKEKADAVGIEFMCSAFSPELLAAVDPFVNIHKLASSEMCHVRMLERLREIGKPVVMSTGAQHQEDIEHAVVAMGDTPRVLMYCVAAYPATRINPYGCSRLSYPSSSAHIPGPRQLVGFSDHTLSADLIPYTMMHYGAVVLEKHVNFVGATGPDAPHSLSADDFKYMCQVLKTREFAASPQGPAPEEAAMITRHKRRLIATRDIGEGDALLEGDNFGIFRSLKDEDHAFSPFMINEVNGKKTMRAIQAGDGIGPGDV